MDSSLVSKAKTVLHSAAARAEKVLTDIKADLKSDRGTEVKLQSGSRNDRVHEEIQKDCLSKEDGVDKNESQKPICKSMEPAKRDWKQYLKNMKRGKAFAEREKIKDFCFDNSDLDENSNKKHLEDIIPVENSGQDLTTAVDSNASSMVIMPPTSVIKQLGIAFEAGKKFKSMKDLLIVHKETSPVNEKSGFVSSISAMKSLVLREKEDKIDLEYSVDEEICSLLHTLFNREEQFPKLEKNSCSSTFCTAHLPRDIQGAPPGSFVVKLAEAVGSIKTLRKMISFWLILVAELRRLWNEGRPIPLLPVDEIPDLDFCLLHQQLQVINCCVARKRRRHLDIESLKSVMEDNTPNTGGSVSLMPSLIYARVKSGRLVLRLGADHPSENLTMLETGEPIYSPRTQEGPLFTEDLLKETEEIVLRTGSFGTGCSQLFSDMQAFKAANPGCILEDFIRWHSPPDWTEGDTNNADKNYLEEDGSWKRGQLSTRMQKEGNLWRELWENAKPLPAVKQTPLFDEDLAVESILNYLEDVSPSEIFIQLFVVVLSSGFAIGESLLPMNNELCKLFNDCKDYVISTVPGEMSGEKIDDLYQVYETMEAIVLHPDDSSTLKQLSEETNSEGLKRRLGKMGLNFTVKNRHFFRRSVPQEGKCPDEKTTRVFSQFLEGKSSLFTKKPTKPSNSEAAPSLCTDESDWTVI
ncbi:hypothetical protein AMTRI_Chr02g215680 [Amborella trichopoda]|uniref:Rab3GAP catalytic subunit conserved domain-containing protein n=2 Tax=Magnoliopsida TaxID=3398 RepID=U5D5A1_AMBTC|nr:rab3 GTPase-activating protein catalytic subunit [Amborella trichopoda]ERN17415.1 hypothetical protein AMTR_s00037p00221920 [Amborella trichopoda]|eukprot:XP_020530134.1 rab3 GTPase-activating protein catalytic subunit [Amborella trichopoda]